MEKNKIIEDVLKLIYNDEKEKAKKVLDDKYPFEFFERNSRQYSDYQKLKVFISDGFIDRYSGNKLIFPPVFRIISKEIPDSFPFHQNWKVSETHIAYWELLPTIDHVIPITRGGEDEDDNWVSTSQLKNSIKSNWLLEELDWELHKKGDIKEWDGLIGWFEKYVEKNPQVLEDKYIKNWFNALKRIKK